MYKQLFILTGLIQTQEVYIDPRCINSVNHKEMNNKVKNSVVYKNYLNHDFLDSIKNQYKTELISLLNSDNEDELEKLPLYHHLDYYFEMFEHIFNLILNDEYNPKLILLLVLTDHIYCKTPGSLSVISLFVSSLIREILALSFNEIYILNNKEEWKRILAINKKYRHLKVHEIENMQENEDFMKSALKSIVFNELRLLNESINQIMNECNVEPPCEWKTVRDNNIKIRIKSTFYEVVNSYIFLKNVKSSIKQAFSFSRNMIHTPNTSSTNPNNENLYCIMFSNKGFRYNRISSEEKNNLYIEGKHEEFSSLYYYSTLQWNTEVIPVDSFKGETFRFKEWIGFEFMMGLLQHYAELTSKVIVCSYEINTHDINILI